MARLRGHHLICLQYFSGTDDDNSYNRNLNEVGHRLRQGEMLEICEGPDDVCAYCGDLSGGHCVYKPDFDTEVIRQDLTAMRLLDVEPGMKTSWQAVIERTSGIILRWQSAVCAGCDWRSHCAVNEMIP